MPSFVRPTTKDNGRLCTLSGTLRLNWATVAIRSLLGIGPQDRKGAIPSLILVRADERRRRHHAMKSDVRSWARIGLTERPAIWPLSGAKRTSASDWRTITIHEYTPSAREPTICSSDPTVWLSTSGVSRSGHIADARRLATAAPAELAACSGFAPSFAPAAACWRTLSAAERWRALFA